MESICKTFMGKSDLRMCLILASIHQGHKCEQASQDWTPAECQSILLERQQLCLFSNPCWFLCGQTLYESSEAPLGGPGDR